MKAGVDYDDVTQTRARGRARLGSRSTPFAGIEERNAA
jgi:hypothetical protein